MRYDPILCMMVDDSVKTQDSMPGDLKKAGYEVGTVEKYGSMYYTLVYNGKVISTSPTEANIVEKAKKHYANRHAKAQDELSLSQKKQVVTELKGFLKKSYNFSDESEYARAYEDLQHMFTTGSRKSISGLFENAVKKTGAHDSVKTKDANKNEGYKIHKAEIRGDKLYLTYTDLLYGGKETESFTKSEAKGFLTDPWNTWEGNTKSVMMKFVKDSKTIDKAIRNCDRDPYEYETIKNDIDVAARGKASYITKSSLQNRITRGFQTNRLTKEQKEELWRLAESVKQ